MRAPRLLITQTPGGLYERFFEEAGKPVQGSKGACTSEDQLALERIVTIGVEYGIEIPPPILQHGEA